MCCSLLAKSSEPEPDREWLSRILVNIHTSAPTTAETKIW
jgi:hypothetical protein